MRELYTTSRDDGTSTHEFFETSLPFHFFIQLLFFNGFFINERTALITTINFLFVIYKEVIYYEIYWRIMIC